jgi:hypothetical protein
MSHNKITVANQPPDSNGNISIDISNLSGVNISSPSDDQVLQYNSSSSEWQNQTLSLGSGLLILGQGDSNAYSNSGASSMSGAVYLYAPNSSIVNTLGATINKYSSTDWVTSITLPAGNYQAIITYRVEFSASGYFNFGLVNNSSNSTKYTNIAYIGENRTTIDNAPSTAIGYFELSGSTTVIIYNNSSSGVDSIANQGNTPSEFSTLMIRKV